ncbi:MAG: formylglycine-generating enzyme family protein [bacterium]
MVLIPAGTFLMGSAEDDPDRHSMESPRHPVTISRDFYLGRYEVTQAQWTVLMESNPSYFQGNGNQPVETVSWEDCLRFIAKLNALGQETFRLPTEAEWEYACRAGTTGPFYWGPDPGSVQITENAWYEGNQSQAGPREVGIRLPNPWGLYDMAGNVAEWCRDWYGPYPASAQTNPTGPVSGIQHVKRGGHWASSAGQCRSAYRFSPGARFGCLGFRLARDYP